MKKIAIAISFIVAIVCYSGAALAGSANFVFDARTGRVLASENADVLNHPASLTKMMTVYMTFEAIKRGKLTWDTKIPFSKYASSRPPTKLGVKPGASITVRDAVYGMIVKSANDAAAAMAEKLGGSESAFAVAMTKRARQLGMNRTVFKNASGLPNSAQVTTARDMATLGVALIRDFPREYKMFSAESFVFNGKRIRGHNNLMYRYEGMDGIKTGYTNASGFNLVSAVRVGDRRVIGVVLGGRSAASRDRTMQALIDRAIGKAGKGDQMIAASKPAPEAEAPAPAAARRAAIAEVPVPAFAPRADDEGVEVAVAEVEADPVNVASVAPVPATRYGNAYVDPRSKGAAAIEAQVAPAPNTLNAQAAAITSGWQIQIAAATSEKAAQSILQSAQSKVRALAGSRPYTQAVKSGGSTLYRARFVGFASEQEARRACDSLTQQSYQCLLMPGEG